MKAVKIMKPNELQIIDMEKPAIDEKNNVLVKFMLLVSVDQMSELSW